MTIIEKELMLVDRGRLLGQAVMSVIPGVIETATKEVIEAAVEIEMGVIIGFTGEIKGKLILSGMESTFQGISEMMYGMRLEGAMLESFTGELGNMISGNFSNELSKTSVQTDICAPTILNGHSRLSGFNIGVQIHITLQNSEQFQLYFLQDQ